MEYAESFHFRDKIKRIDSMLYCLSDKELKKLHRKMLSSVFITLFIGALLCIIAYLLWIELSFFLALVGIIFLGLGVWLFFQKVLTKIKIYEIEIDESGITLQENNYKVHIPIEEITQILEYRSGITVRGRIKTIAVYREFPEYKEMREQIEQWGIPFDILPKELEEVAWNIFLPIVFAGILLFAQYFPKIGIPLIAILWVAGVILMIKSLLFDRKR